MSGKKQDKASLWDILDKPTVFPGENREICRPVIRVRTVLFSVFIRLLITGLVSFVVSYVTCFLLRAYYEHPVSEPAVYLVCAAVCLFLLLIISLKRILIFMVLVYQAKASDETRLRCFYVPTCSEYMILSLKKYGVVRGLIKGLKRLKRCRDFGNGGEDYP
ncbi:MAG: membrane protein insertion efficiency factor YidD [Firmicutes bacterium]|nr:membrane protein insertion efficiency factor YidD [Bacillota bacterium]